MVCEKGREVPYQRFHVADEFIMVDKFSDIVNEDVQQKLRDLNSIVVPHGSFVAYAGLDNVEDKFNVPMFGNRDILRWEAERNLERKLITKSGIRMPQKYETPEDIDRAVMVKFPGARRPWILRCINNRRVQLQDQGHAGEGMDNPGRH